MAQQQQEPPNFEEMAAGFNTIVENTAKMQNMVASAAILQAIRELGDDLGQRLDGLSDRLDAMSDRLGAV